MFTLDIKTAIHAGKHGEWNFVVVGKSEFNDSEIATIIEMKMCEEKIVHIDERFVPKILVDLGHFSSNGEIRRNKPDFVVTFPDNHIGWHTIQVSKNGPNKNKFVCLIVGPKY